jgi:hypothetical protein
MYPDLVMSKGEDLIAVYHLAKGNRDGFVLNGMLGVV